MAGGLRARGVLGAAAVALAACVTAPAPGPATPPASRAFYAGQVLDVRDAALNAHDAAAAAAVYAQDAVVFDADSGAVVLRGRTEIREAHARFLDACPRARVEVLDRAWDEQARIVSDLERVRCDRPPGVEGLVRYEVEGGAIVRVLQRRSPPFAAGG